MEVQLPADQLATILFDRVFVCLRKPFFGLRNRVILHEECAVRAAIRPSNSSS